MTDYNESANYVEQFQAWVDTIDGQYNARRQGYVGPGWLPILKDCFAKLRSCGWLGNILQIKEKFGVLRLYISQTSQEISEIVSSYERVSATVCEKCGAPATTKATNMWLSTLCESCQPIQSKQ